MRRLRLESLALALTLLAAPLTASAQFRGPRSADYMFVSQESDARTVWVNPASLGTEFDATLMAELFVARNPIDDFALAQYTVGFSSRGFGFGYRRDRFDDSTAGNTFRLGFGRGMRRLSVGGSITLYTDETDQRAGDLGVRFLLMPALDIGVVLANIGKPTVRGVRLPIVGTLGAALNLFGGSVSLAGEAAAVDRETVSGYDLSYRGGIRIATDGRMAVGALATVQLNDDFGITRVLLGLQIGGADRGIAVADGIRGEGGTLDGISLAGIARRPLRSR